MDEKDRVETPLPLAEAGEMGRVEAEREGLPEGESLARATPAGAGDPAAPAPGQEAPAPEAPPAGEEAKPAADTTAQPAANTAGGSGQIWKSGRKDKDGKESKVRPGGKAARENTFKEKYWKPILHPIVALVAICIVTSFLLGVTNMVTAPIIADNAAAVANEARTALLPEADGFEPVDITAEVAGVTAMYQATNGAGYVIEASASGYGGQVPVMVAFDAEGTIVGVTFLENSETPGLGKKLETDADFAAQFTGQPAQPIAANSIDKIASATVSSNAAVTAINAAIELFNQQVLGIVGGALTPEQVLDQLAGATPPTAITISAEGVQPTAYRTSYGYIIYGEAKGVHSTIVAAVAMNEEGELEDLWLDTSGEGAGYGDGVGNDPDFVNAMKHQYHPVQVDAVAGGTLTSDAALEAVNNALAALPAARSASAQSTPTAKEAAE